VILREILPDPEVAHPTQAAKKLSDPIRSKYICLEPITIFLPPGIV